MDPETLNATDVLRNPDVLPTWMPCECLLLTSEKLSTDLLPSVPLPPDLTNAVPKRRLHFLGGRLCALRALARLTGRTHDGIIPRGPAGNPLWPEGVVGSITHAGDFVWAAVAWNRLASGIGIDSECVMSDAQQRQVERSVLGETERQPPVHAAFDLQQWTTFVFSAKEALFKCVYPLIGRRFYYADATVTDVDSRRATFEVRLERDLGEGFVAGRVIRGRFELSERYVHTAIWLPGRDNQAAERPA